MTAETIDLKEARKKLKAHRGGKPRAPVRKTAEDKVVAKPLTPPKSFCDERKRIWREMAKALADAKIITELDRFALERLVNLTYHSRHLWERAEAEGYVFYNDIGERRPLPELTAALRSENATLPLLKGFGMLPENRSKMRVFSKPGDDPFLQLVQQLAQVMQR